MSTKFEAVDSVPPRRRGSRTPAYLELFEACRANPGQWFKLDGLRPSTLAHQIKAGLIAGAERGEFEAVTRNTVGGRGEVYVRLAPAGEGA